MPPSQYYTSLPACFSAGFDSAIWESVEIDLKYAGYIARQEASIEKLRRSDEKLIPERIDYGFDLGSAVEARQKLESIRPETIGHAARISGVTPPISRFSIHVSRK